MSARTRLIIGLSFAIGGNLLFFTGWWLWFPWSTATKVKLGAVLFFAPETGTCICVAIIGRENYQCFLNVLRSLWRRWRGRPDPLPAPEKSGDSEPAGDSAERNPPPDIH